MRRRLFAVGAALAGVGLVIACANIIGIEDLTRAEREAGPRADTSPMPDTSLDPCTQDPGPPQPAASTEGTSIAPVWLAANSIAFDGVDGLNLDNACTTDQASSPCKLLSFAPSYQGDLPGAGYPRHKDNASRELLAVKVGSTTFASALATAVAARIWSIGFRLSDYNGRADDPSVTLQIASLAPATNKAWLASRESVDGGSVDGATASAKAWVNGGQLVAFFEAPLDMAVRIPPNQTEPFPVTLLMSLHSVILTADVMTDAGPPTLQNGVFGARWATGEAVAQVGSVDKGTCLVLLNSQCKKTSDVLLERSQDRKSAEECNSLSSAFAFTTAASDVTAVQSDAGVLPATTCKCP